MYYYEDYYTKARTITREQAHIIAERAANTGAKYPIHRKLDAMRTDAKIEVAKLNGQWMVYCGTVTICYLFNDMAQDVINSVCV